MNLFLSTLNLSDTGRIEFKVFNPRREKDIQETLKNALQQIEDRKYETALRTKGIPAEHIRKYGFAFEGKNVLIG